MPYSAIPDRAIPYHIDGSVIKILNSTSGVIKSLTSAEMLEINDTDFTFVSCTEGKSYVVVFFPELRDITAIFSVLGKHALITPFYMVNAMTGLQWSADSTNGLDGTWTNATLSSGYPPTTLGLDDWRKAIKPITGISGARAIRFVGVETYINGIYVLHLYGTKHAGETADDIIFLDAEDGDAEFDIPLDFGNRPAGTSVIRQIKVKNTSTTLAASNLVVEVVDPLDIVRLSDSSGGPWATSKTIVSLAANTASDVIYVKCETPAPPTPLGPVRAPITATVGAWT